MKKNCINKVLQSGLILSFLLPAIACNSGKDEKTKLHAEHSQEAKQYTCPMHPQILRDQPGKCPICGMELVPLTAGNTAIGLDSNLAYLLKPVNEQIIATIPVIVPEKSSRVYTASVQGAVTYDTRNNSSIASRVSGRIERLLIKHNYQLVTKGQLIMEIYSPDLAAAQRELIYLVKSNAADNLVQSAKQRLSLLGMNASLIEEVVRKSEPLYRIPIYSTATGYILEQSAKANLPQVTVNMGSTASSEGDGMGMGAAATSTPAVTAQPANPPVLLREGQYISAGQSLFSIYSNQSLVAEFAFPASLAATAQPGKQILYYLSNDTTQAYTGKIGLVQPVMRAGQNFTLVRVYAPPAGFTIGQLLTADIAIAINDHYWLPQAAVLDLGNRRIVFKKEKNVFIPQTVKTGIKAKGFIEILDDIGNWQLANNAYYLVDSESFIPATQNN